ncbi:MFS transporter [Massilia cavernae]|uniref:MFS transporter n=1 Tax=Massilia cavernae TaxID=2320864 RepID=A0A418Y821_9BURK|nr:MFS transporter [Massilia cavernae]RJG27489.1 MFS transporter [Massilia cavernae]
MVQKAVRGGPTGQGRAVVLTTAAFVALLPLLAFLLLGDLAWSLKERAVPELVKLQLMAFSQNLLLVNLMFGALPAGLALLAGPPVGAWSDRTRTRLGRRIPFLLAGAPLLAGSLVGLAYSEPLADYLLGLGVVAPGYRRQAVIGCILLFWTLYELITVMSTPLFLALITDTVPHRLLGRVFGLFRIVSLAVGALFFYYVFGNNVAGVAPQVMLVIAIVYLVAFTLLCLCIREPAYPPPTPTRQAWRGLERLGAGEGKAPWFYVLLFGAVGVSTISSLPVNINSQNAIAQFGVDPRGFGQAVAVTYCISIALALPLGWLADRFHPLRIGVWLVGLYALSMLAAWLCVTGRTSFLIWLVVHGVLAGAVLSGTASLLPIMLPAERFSELAAFYWSMTAILTVVLTLATGAVLDWSGSDFRLTFLAAGLFALIGTVLWIAALRAWRRATHAAPWS